MQPRLNRYWVRLLLFAAYVLIIGCSKEDMPFPRCISADYFGPEPITVGAHFSDDDKNAFTADNGEVTDSNTGELNYGFHPNQVVRWKDTGLETNGDNLVVRVNGSWTSWSHNNARESKKNNLDLQKLEQLKYSIKLEGETGDKSLPDFNLVCNDYKSSTKGILNRSNTSCSTNCKHINKDTPCWFTNGHGAYLLLKKSGDPDPNDTLEHMRYPVSPTVHLGYNSVADDGSGIFILESSKIKDKECNSITLEKGWKIYIKILDRYYLDNRGGYSLEFLGGVNKPDNYGVFNYIYNYLKCTLLIYKDKNCTGFDNKPAAAQEMFKNIAEKSSDFHDFVVSLLILFTVISSLLYLFGMIQETKHDLIIRMMKIILVVVLISPGSFKFFYNHFLALFIEGLEYLIKVISNFSPNASNDKLFSFMENMYDKFFAYSVWRKFAAFFHYQMWTSIFMMPAIFVGIVLYFLLCSYTFIIFLSGFIGIAFLIAIMPLFLISILFSQLKSLFEGWIKFSISFCLQSVMLFTLLSLFAAIIMNTFYRQLGFTVCYNKWLEVKLCTPKWFFGGVCMIDNQYFSWTPGQIFVPYTVGEPSSFSLDENIEGISREGGTVKFTGGAGYIPIPPDYTKEGFRYIDYPFFEPIPNADHHIMESDIIVECKSEDEDLKKLVRLTNSLSYALEKFDILSFISSIDEKIDIDERIEELCKKQENKEQCDDYRKAINDYRKGILQPSLKSKIKFLVKEVIKNSLNCQLKDFHELNKEYQDNSDYQRVQDIKKGYFIDVKEIFILFLLSFLMFSLRKLVQEMSSSFAGGGYSVYSISSMYNASPLASIMQGFKQQAQDFSGGKLNSLGEWATRLPNRMAGGTANLLGRVPVVGEALRQTINVQRKLVNISIEATKVVTSPENNIDKFEEKIFKAFGVDQNDMVHRKIDKYLEYYKGYVGSHLGCSLKDAIEFNWEHGRNSIGKKGYDKDAQLYTGKVTYKDDLLYMAKVHRKDFLLKLYDYTIGLKEGPRKDNELNKIVQKEQGTKPVSNETVQRKLGTESKEIIKDSEES